MHDGVEPTHRPDATDRTGPERRTIALHAEELAVVRRVRNTLVRVAARTETTVRLVEEELARDDVAIERVPVNRVVDAVPPVRRDGDVLVLPVVEEELVVTRRLVLKEEVHLRTVRTTRRHAEHVTLRREEATETRTGLGTRPPAISQPATEHPAMNDEYALHDETIVAAYETPAQAGIVANELRAAGVPSEAIGIHDATVMPSGLGDAAAPPRERGFWASIFGGEPDHDTAIYDRSLERGASVVSVRVPQNFVPRATAIIEKHAPLDIDEHAALRDAAPMAGARPAAAAVAPATAGIGTADRADDGTLRLSEEELAVGKRVVNRGGTRIRRFVVERPVQQDVTLHDERVVVDRHPVTDGRAAAPGAFTERSIEMTESAEEAVVSKTARVYEEVGLRKEAVDRSETVRDTLRREEVEVERIPGAASATTDTAVDPALAPPRPTRS